MSTGRSIIKILFDSLSSVKTKLWLGHTLLTSLNTSFINSPMVYDGLSEFFSAIFNSILTFKNIFPILLNLSVSFSITSPLSLCGFCLSYMLWPLYCMSFVILFSL